MRVVLDASAAVRLVMRAETAERLLDPIARAVLVLAPSLYASEVANAMCKLNCHCSPSGQNRARAPLSIR